MTDLQLGLLIASGAIVGAVYGFNWWQEYRYKKQANKAFSRNQPDVLLETPKNMVRSSTTGARLEPAVDAPRSEPLRNERLEPALSGASRVDFDLTEALPEDDLPPVIARTPAPAPQREPVQRVEQQRAEPARAQAALESEDVEVLATSQLDPKLDFVAEIHAGELIPAAEIPTLPGPKRVEIIGLNIDDQWEIVAPNSTSSFAELRIGLQLADRQGALTPEQLNAFCMGVQQFADDFDAVVTFPQRSSKLQSAQELDEFCAGVDVLIGLNLLAVTQPFPMEKVRALVDQAGLVRGPDGLFHYKSDSGKTLFTLANLNQKPFGPTSEGLTLLFDVPRVAGGIAVFDYLTEFAQNLAASLAGDLVDDNGKPLTSASLANIRKQLGGIYAQMDDRGIAPGSMAALRLFA
ncbi:cell division protein ZipA C-terminal FtsZ-binding domain-containing protein [Andreprevotia chitinilytica]|uniref:cell division protein ZipA C-terminal FtsZ-binding domain-containing protein n=1 Tax=Andreprevotia chitinilytica TaxID=396808 RepID=UPI000552F217|nr:cell division protein ZipA C-terminal FtsZ-binding domain-containing protein [Andreprevotia chitinilytica]